MRGAAVVAVAGMVAAACGPSAAERVARRRAAGELVVVLPRMPNTLDWNRSDETRWVNYPVALATMKGLTELGPGHAPRPALAARWETETTPEGHAVYVFHLREDVRWSDGTPLVADDFVLGFHRAMLGATADVFADLAGADEVARLRGAQASEGEVARALERTGVRALDPHTLRVEWTRPRSYYLARLAGLYEFFPAPSSALRGLGPAAQREYFEHPAAGRPLALGPFRVERWDRAAEVLRLARNPRSAFAPALAPGERPVERVTLETSDVGYALYRRGQLDFVSIDAAAGVRSAGALAHREPLLSTFFLAMDTRRSPLDRREVRLAIAHAIDRAALFARLVPDARASNTLLPPDLPGAESEAQRADLPGFDPARARALLASVGGVHRPLRLLVDGAPSIVPESGIARRLRQQLAAVGIELELDEREADYAERRAAGDFDLYLRRIGADYAHPDTFFSVFRAGGNSGTGFESLAGGEPLRRFEDALARADRFTEPAQGQADYAAAEHILLSEQAVLVPLFHPDRYYLVQPSVRGLTVDPFNFLSLAQGRFGAAP